MSESELDTKLREIIGTIGESHPGYDCCEGCGKDLDKGLAQIKEALSEAGFRRVDYRKDTNRTDINSITHLTTYSGELQYGSEWYDRFVQEYNKLKTPVTSAEAVHMLYEVAAKRAAGIEE